MASPQPRIGVVTYPGLERRPRRALGARRARRGGGPRLARGARAARPRRGRAARRLLVRRLPPLRRDRALLAGDRRGRASSRTPAGSCSGSATASRSSARPACCRACCCGTSRFASSAATCRSSSSATTCRSRRAARPGSGSCIPVKHGDGRWFAPPELVASSRRTARSCSATATTRTARSTTSPASATRRGNVMGLMPHPEHAVDPLLGSADGALHPRVARRRRARARARTAI